MPSNKMSRVMCILCALLLSACAATERDTRYLQSEQRPPLQVPAGMDTPNYNPQMQVPGNPAPLDPARVDSSFDSERPPQLDESQ